MESAELISISARRQHPVRAPIAKIPAEKQQRERLHALARAHVQEQTPVPPIPLSELRRHADHIIHLAQADPIYRDYVAILVNNELWREPLAAVPYSRRLLLLPKCLRSLPHCTAAIDEFGLLCKQCGSCAIHELQAEAERLGYAVLVAEGSALVTQFIRTGKIDAIVGVSCMSVLEQTFPYMEAAAIPGFAIPLLQDD